MTFIDNSEDMGNYMMFGVLPPQKVYSNLINKEKLIRYADNPINYLLIQYYRLEGAIAARNCLHKAAAPNGTVMLVEYVVTWRMNWLKEQFDKHPKVMFPLVGLIATILTVVLFDPLRTWCMFFSQTIPIN